MARTFYTPVDLTGNEIRNVLIQSLASDPTPGESRLYYNNTTHRLRYYDGTVWQELAQEVFTLAAHNATDHSAVAGTFTLNEVAAPTTGLDLNSQKIINLLNPTNPQDAATKAYVDAARSGLDVKDSVRAIATTNLTLSGLQTVDGVSLASNDRVLVAGQTTGADNGIYTASTGAWVRATDADTSAKVTSGMFTFVAEGAANDNSGWVLATNDPITLGTTSLAFTQFSGAGQITAGAGLTKTGNTIDVGQGTGIIVNADDVAVDTTYVVRKYNADVGDGSSTAITVTHSLGTRDVLVQVFRNTTPYEQVEMDVEHTSTSAVTLRFTTAPTAAQYRVTIHA